MQLQTGTLDERQIVPMLHHEAASTTSRIVRSLLLYTESNNAMRQLSQSGDASPPTPHDVANVP